MARRYQGLTDEDLAARVLKFTDAIEAVVAGGDVSVIQTDGRRMEYTRGNLGDAERILGLLLDEQEMRANNGVLRGRALGMRFMRP